MKRVALIAVAGLFLPLSGCRKGGSSAPTGNVVARKITTTADLIGGPRAEGRLGDFLLANDHVRVIVSDKGSAVGFNVFGGSLLDADVVRLSSDPGNDRFGETFPSINVLTISDVDTVEVKEDGTDRHRASIHVHGPGYQFPIVAPIPGLTNAINCEIDTVYSLTPDSSSVLIETTVTSNEAQHSSLQEFDVFLLGTGLDFIGAPLGVGQTGTYDWYGADGTGIGYAWVPIAPDVKMDIPFVDAGQQVAVMGTVPDIAPGAKVTYRRRLVIAKNLGDAMTEIERIRGKATGTFSGLVKDTVGGPVADAFVTITQPGVDENADGIDDTIARARTDSTGSFSVALPAGHYSAVVTAGLRGSGAPLAFPITNGKLSQALLVIPALGTVTFTPTDSADASPMPGKLTLLQGGSIIARALAGPLAEGSVQVPPGDYDAVISRGPEWGIAQSTLTVTAGGSVAVSAASLTRVVATPGWVAGDYHLHSVQSRDSGVPLDTRVLSLAAEGLEYVSSTDHDRATDYMPSATSQGLLPFFAAMIGAEYSIPIYGHFNAYPMPADAAQTRAYDGTKMWFDAFSKHRLDAAELVAEARAIPGDRIVQMNHPRSVQGYLDAIGYSPFSGTSTQALATTFDTMEVNDSIDASTGVMADWFSLLKQGIRFTAVGVSDSHITWNPGYPRTMVNVGTDDPAAVTEPGFIAAVRAGHVIVSSGPFLTMTASTSGGGTIAQLGDTLRAPGGSATLHVHVESPAWAPYDTLTIFQNGTAISTTALTPPLVGGLFLSDVDVSVAPAIDAFYVAIVTGPGSLYPVNGGGVFAYTNPIFLDVGIAGWNPPGL